MMLMKLTCICPFQKIPKPRNRNNSSNTTVINYFLPSPSKSHLTPRKPFLDCVGVIALGDVLFCGRSATFSKYIRLGAKPGTIIRKIQVEWNMDQIQQTRNGI